MVEPIRKKRIYELAVDRIMELITGGDYQVGDVLPAEREFAEQYGISRASVREAMIVLQRAGMIDISPGRGAVIKRTLVPSVKENLTEFLKQDKEDILELLELRRGIEIESASLAAKRCSQKGMERLTNKYKELELEVKMNRLGAKADYDFHMTLAELTKNKFYLQVMYTISDLISDSLEKTRLETLTREGGPEMVLKEHKAILDAVKNRDEKWAREAMRGHLDGVIYKIHNLVE